MASDIQCRKRSPPCQNRDGVEKWRMSLEPVEDLGGAMKQTLNLLLQTLALQAVQTPG